MDIRPWRCETFLLKEGKKKKKRLLKFLKRLKANRLYNYEQNAVIVVLVTPRYEQRGAREIKLCANTRSRNLDDLCESEEQASAYSVLQYSSKLSRVGALSFFFVTWLSSLNSGV